MHLLFEQFDQLTQAPENLKSLRQWIIDLGVRGQLTQAWRAEHPETEPASVLLEKISVEKARLVKEKKIKKSKPLPPTAADDVPYILPESWVWCWLGDLGVCQTGSTPKTDIRSNFGDYIPFIKPADITTGSINYGNEGLSKEGLQTSTYVPSGSLLMVCIGGSIGKSFYNVSAVSCNQQINTILPLSDTEVKLLQYFLQSTYFQELLWSKASGNTTPIVNRGKWEKLPVPLPPLAEQQAIVEKVESLLDKVSQLQERAGEVADKKITVGKSICGWLANASLGGETAQRVHSIAPQFDDIFSTLPNLKALRQTILQLAIQGKLTEAWRAAHPEVEPAAALLERIQAEKARLVQEKKIKKPKPLSPITEDEVPFELPEGWVWCRLGDCSINRDGERIPVSKAE